MSVILKFKSHLQINKMFVIKHFTKLSQFLAARHIKHMSRFSQVSANVSTFNTDAIVSGRSFGPASNSNSGSISR